MKQADGSIKPSMAERLKDEVFKYLTVTAYLYVCFGALLLYKSVLLSEEGVHYLPFGFALVKALVLAKFILLGDAMQVGQRSKARVLWRRIAWQSIALLLLLLVLTGVEEIVVGWIHGESLAAVMAELNSATVLSVFATSLVMLLILVPFVASREIDRMLGFGSLGAMLRSDAVKQS
jgi:hypothetical protein